METDELLNYLGLASDDARLVSYLNKYGITEQPQLADGDYRAYLERPSDGFSLVFTDEAQFKGIKKKSAGSGSLFFTGAFFYSENYEGYSAFKDELPQGLSFSDDRPSALNKLGESSWQMKGKDSTTILAERWEQPNYRLRVNYLKDGNSVGQIFCGLPDKK